MSRDAPELHGTTTEGVGVSSPRSRRHDAAAIRAGVASGSSTKARSSPKTSSIDCRRAGPLQELHPDEDAERDLRHARRPGGLEAGVDAGLGEVAQAGLVDPLLGRRHDVAVPTPGADGRLGAVREADGDALEEVEALLGVRDRFGQRDEARSRVRPPSAPAAARRTRPCRRSGGRRTLSSRPAARTARRWSGRRARASASSSRPAS